ncbi:MAG TPA: glycosyltransferase family 39 protein [Caulobacterales bacterium]|nr:glycosyltransferase family 39 protein [Caulobacterales bacterium]
MAPPPVPSLFEQFARGWRGYALIALIALASALPGVGRMPVMDRDEARFAQASRQMLETGDFVRIRIQGEARNKKPIGIHWLQTAAVEASLPFTGGRLNEIWAYRLPSVLGGMLAGMAAFWAGTALMGRRAAFMGAALFSTGVLMGFEAMTAKTDAMLVGFTTVALAALARLYAQRPTFSLAEQVAAKRPDGGRATDAGVAVAERPSPPSPSPPAGGGNGLALMFWVALGAGVLTKGPVTPLVAGLSLAALALWERRLVWMRALLWWPGPALAALIVAPWLIAIGQATHGGFFAAMFGGDIAPKIAGGQEGHASPPGYHTLLLPALIFPATFALPAAARLAWRLFRTPRSEPAPLRFLLAWALPTFVAFELLPTKLAHYTLPTYPAIALLCGAAAFMSWREHWRWTKAIGIALFALGGAALVAVLAFGATYMPGDAAAALRREIQAALLGGGVLIAGLIVISVFTQPFVRAGAAIIAAVALSYMLREHVLPEARSLHVSAEAEAALTRARLTPSATRPLWVIGYRETSLIFLTRTDIRLATPGDAGHNAAVGDALIVEGRRLPETDAELAARGLVFAQHGAPVTGLDYGNGHHVALFVGEVAPTPAD